MTGNDENAPSSSPGLPGSARLLALLALVTLAATLALLVATTLHHLWYLLAALAALSLAASAMWVVLTSRRWRWPALVAGLALVAGAGLAMWAAGDDLVATLLVIAGTALCGGLTAGAVQVESRAARARKWRPVPAARRPVLVMNPKSGGGKVARSHLAAECAARGIEAIELRPGDDLRAVAESAVAGGSDAIGMAGGDGSLGLVAAVAAAHDVAFVCVPAGTRNHLARDLGVAPDDLTGALDAFGPALESRVDLAEVNGRVFVNNVSLGLYATMVETPTYREKKVRTAAQTLEERLGPDVPPYDLHLDGPHGKVDGAHIVQVSNNPYKLTSLSSFGARQHLDGGVLGVVTLRLEGRAQLGALERDEVSGHPGRAPGLRSWTAPTLEVRSSSPVGAGIDGEACCLHPPLRFAARPAALRVRIAESRSATPPAVRRPPLPSSVIGTLVELSSGRPSGLVD
jgi:diacylglycerol kinase family enzyme